MRQGVREPANEDLVTELSVRGILRVTMPLAAGTKLAWSWARRDMSSEQVRGKTVDHRADIFAFGAILYEMLTGDFGKFNPATCPERQLTEKPTFQAFWGYVRIAGKPAATPWVQQSPNRSLILTGVIYSRRYGKGRTFDIPFSC